MMSVDCVAIFWIVNASSGERSCLQFSIPTGSGAGGEGDVSHSLNMNNRQTNYFSFLRCAARFLEKVRRLTRFYLTKVTKKGRKESVKRKR